MTGKRKLGRPKGSGNPAYAAVEVLARDLAPYCRSNNEAVRRAIDYHLLFGGWTIDNPTQGGFVLAPAEHHVDGLIPDPDKDINGTRVIAADTPRQKARRRQQAADREPVSQQTAATIVVETDALPRAVETLLGPRDTVVDQIARKLPAHPARRKNSIG